MNNLDKIDSSSPFPITPSVPSPKKTEVEAQRSKGFSRVLSKKLPEIGSKIKTFFKEKATDIKETVKKARSSVELKIRRKTIDNQTNRIQFLKTISPQSKTIKDNKTQELMKNQVNLLRSEFSNHFLLSDANVKQKFKQLDELIIKFSKKETVSISEKLLFDTITAELVSHAHTLDKANIPSNAEKHIKHVQEQFVEFRGKPLPEEHLKRVQEFVLSKMEDWQKPDFTRERYRHDHSDVNLPYSLDVFQENGQLYIMVLLKTGKGVAELGHGSSKFANVAIDWQTGNLFADVVVSENSKKMQKKGSMSTFEEKAENFEREHRILEAVKDKPNVVSAHIGFHDYIDGKGVKKISAFQPIYSTSLDKLLKTEPDSAKKLELFKGMVRGTNSLLEGNVEHRDLHFGNFFISDEGQALVADFDTSRVDTEDSQHPDYKFKYSKDFMNLGNRPMQSPQRAHALDLRAQLSNEERIYQAKMKNQSGNLVELKVLENHIATLRNEFLSFVNGTWKGNDTWSLGILGLLMITDEKEHSKINEFFANLSVLQEGTKRCGPEQYGQMQNKVDQFLNNIEGKVTDPNEKLMFQAIKGMLIVDDKNRSKPSQTLDLLQ